MNSHYEPLGERRHSKWVPLAVVAMAVSVGAIAGLSLSSANTSLYTTAVRAAPTQAQAVRPLQGPRQEPLLAASQNSFQEQVDESAFQYTMQEAASSGGAGWSSLAVIPIAAVAGFFFGSRKSVKAPQAIPETFEVVIDDGEADEVAMAATTGAKELVYAVVAVGGHQYLVQPGEILSVDKMPLEVGDEFAFEKVLLVKNGEKVDFGHPYLANAVVKAEVLRNSKGRKIRVFKYRAKKHYRLTKGHRQKYTDIHITELAGHKVPSKVNFADLSATADNLVKA